MTQQSIKEIENAREWGKMLVAPQTNMTRAPSSTPYLASRTKFVRAFDIKHSETRDGSFAVFMFPSPKVAMLASSPVAEQAGADLSLNPINNANVDSDGYLTNETMLVQRANGEAIGTTGLGPLTVDAAKRPGLNCTIDTANPITVIMKASGDFAKVFWRVVFFNGAGTPDSQGLSDMATVQTVVFPSVPYTVRGIGIRILDKSGAKLPDYAKLAGEISVTFKFSGSAQLAEKNVCYDLVQSSILDAGRIQSQRCTAMSMLVTNLAPPISAGGEIVTARCLPGVLAMSSPVAIAEEIKRLPEERYWRSGPIVDGAYVWWLPDNLTGYEPLPIPDVPNAQDNCLVASGTFSNADGVVRLVCTWTFEFYTPVQLFDRSYNTTYSDAHRRVFEEATKLDACSANFGHVALVGSVFAAVSSVYNFYLRHEKAVDALAHGVKSLLWDRPPPPPQQKKAKPNPPPRQQQQAVVLALPRAPQKPKRQRKRKRPASRNSGKPRASRPVQLPSILGID